MTHWLKCISITLPSLDYSWWIDGSSIIIGQLSSCTLRKISRPKATYSEGSSTGMELQGWGITDYDDSPGQCKVLNKANVNSSDLFPNQMMFCYWRKHSRPSELSIHHAGGRSAHYYHESTIFHIGHTCQIFSCTIQGHIPLLGWSLGCSWQFFTPSPKYLGSCLLICFRHFPSIHGLLLSGVHHTTADHRFLSALDQPFPTLFILIRPLGSSWPLEIASNISVPVNIWSSFLFLICNKSSVGMTWRNIPVDLSIS